MSDSAGRAEIESYHHQVLQGKISCELPPCPFCGAPDCFRRHEARRRTFYVVGDQWVEIVLCRITRWKCSHCGKIRTQHPPFALPYKRYTRQTLMGFSQAYLEDEASSYRKAVLEDGLPIGFASKPGEEEIDERQLAHSTLYRWVTTLGGFKEVLRSGLGPDHTERPRFRHLPRPRLSKSRFLKIRQSPTGIGPKALPGAPSPRGELPADFSGVHFPLPGNKVRMEMI